MRALALDTSWDPCGLALADEGGVVAAMSFRHEREVSRWWAERLDWMLTQVGWTLRDLDGLVVCGGPGSFTGLRIGMAAAKTLTQALERPLVEVSSLELLALPYRAAWPGAVASVLHCRQGEVYCEAYSPDGAVLLPAAVVTVEKLAQNLNSLPKPLLVCGAVGPKDTLPLPDDARRGDPWLATPNVERLALEGVRRLEAGLGVDPLTVTVRYLKRSQAEEQAEAYRKDPVGTA